MKSTDIAQAGPAKTRKKLRWTESGVSKIASAFKSKSAKSAQNKFKTINRTIKPKSLKPMLNVKKINGDEIGAKIVVSGGRDEVYARISARDDEGTTHVVALSRDANKFSHPSLKKGWNLHVELFPHNSFSKNELAKCRMKFYTDFSDVPLGTLDEELAVLSMIL